ncbi:MAG: NADH:ubiquinone reductase (Na(+)-transporting) subunit F [Odoribacteraceae bacterium]|jgi:Na+-transporting NADH:ubiquinone oxidoreductase subunit F|nr:NADH:ubiquinone reductase (Na(+)-transporting) subunit F [Odoribacteraceae bacterium]
MNITLLATATLLFLAIVLLLVGMLLLAKNKLMPRGKVKIDINRGESLVDASPGDTLLAALGNNKIFLPSACGGKGSCGMCRCRVDAGAGSILATETGFFTYKQRHDNWRLACQVKIRENTRVNLPAEILGIKKWECEVVSNRNVATFIKEFIVKLPEGEHLRFKSGGYIQVDVPRLSVDFAAMDIDAAYRGDWERMKLFDLKMVNTGETYRAYSMANHPAEGNIIMLNVRIATPPVDRATGRFARVNPGVCSSYIFSRVPGDKVTISGPYGEFFLKDTGNEMMFIGGGAGMAPMRSHIFHLFKTLATGRRVTFWYGARSMKEVFYREEFDAIARAFPNFTWQLALSEPLPEDHWTGPTGFIHQVILDNYLKTHDAPEDIEYYICGPPLMNAAVVNMLDNLGVAPENILYDDFGA